MFWECIQYTTYWDEKQISKKNIEKEVSNVKKDYLWLLVILKIISH